MRKFVIFEARTIKASKSLFHADYDAGTAILHIRHSQCPLVYRILLGKANGH